MSGSAQKLLEKPLKIGVGKSFYGVFQINQGVQIRNYMGKVIAAFTGTGKTYFCLKHIGTYNEHYGIELLGDSFENKFIW